MKETTAKRFQQTMSELHIFEYHMHTRFTCHIQKSVQLRE